MFRDDIDRLRLLDRDVEFSIDSRHDADDSFVAATLLVVRYRGADDDEDDGCSNDGEEDEENVDEGDEVIHDLIEQ